MAGDFNCCGGCKKATYCSATCMKLAWPTHKLTCAKSKREGGKKKRKGGKKGR